MVDFPRTLASDGLPAHTGRSTVLRYGIAIGSVGLALLARAAIAPLLGDKLPFIWFLVAVAAAAWFGGSGPSRLSMALGFMAAEVFFIRHDRAWWIVRLPDLAVALSYFASASIIVLMTRAAHRNREQAIARQIQLEHEIGERLQAENALRKAHDELEARVSQRTTELERALETQEREKRRFEEVMDRLPVCVALLTPDRHIAFSNRMFRERFGKPNGGRCFEDIYQRSEPCEFCENRKVLETGQPHDWECKGPDGRRYQVSSFPFRDVQGSALILDVRIDITEMKRVQARLSEQAALLQLAHDAILVTDLDGKISFWNSGAEGIYGWGQEEALGANVHELLQTTSNLPVSEIKAEVQDRGQWEGELAHVTKGGQTVVVMSRWSLQRDRHGKPNAILEINRDVTERKRAQEALRHSEEQHRALVVATSQIVWTTDPDGLVTDIPSWRAFTGQSEDEVRGRGWIDALHPEDRERTAALWSEAVRNHTIYTTGYRILKVDGEFRHVSVRAVPVRRADGSVRGWIGPCIDVTDRKRAEDALRQSNRKLHQLSRDLLRTQDYERRRIARELHDSTAQLLAALKINISRLQENGLDPDRRQKALSEAAELATACSAEIRTVTYLLHPPLLDEVGLVEALKAYAQGFNQRTGIQVEIKLSADFGRLASDLEATLFRITQEGLANVHKHSGSPLVVIRLERDEREVRLVLQDRGRGIPDALCPEANGFVRFGVGIMGMRERAEQLGGLLELASNAAGTRLTVTLPLVQSDEKDANLVSR